MTTQVEKKTIWSFIDHSNCEVTRNRTFRSEPFRSEPFRSGPFRSRDISVTTFL